MRTKMHRHLLIVILLLVATVFSWVSGLDGKAGELIDHSLKRALISFATAAKCSSGISWSTSTDA